MATLTAGTKATTSLTALQWQFSGLAAADIATMNNAIRMPVTGGFGGASATGLGRIENGVLYLPARGADAPAVAIPIQPGDWIMIDGKGWPVIVPNSIFSNSWTHS